MNPLALLCALCALVQPAEPRPESKSLATDFVRAMLAHDSSVRSLKWRQTYRQYVPAARADGVCKSVHAFDELGRWNTTFERTSFAGPDAGFLVSTGHLIYDGSRLVALNRDKKTSTIDCYRGERRSHMSVECFLGRELDAGRRRLGEVLLSAPDLEASRTERGVILSGTADLPDLVALLEVEIDPQHDFAPRVVIVRDRALRLPYFRYEVTEFVRQDGTCLPLTAFLETRKFQPDPEQARALGQALERRGISRSSDIHSRITQDLYDQAVQEAFGSQEAPSTQLVEPVRVEFAYVEVNGKIEDSEFAVSNPTDYLVMDFLTDQIRPRGGARWVPRVDYRPETKGSEE